MTQHRSRSGERVLEHTGRVHRLTHVPHDFDVELAGGTRVDWSGPTTTRSPSCEPLSATIDSRRQVRLTGVGWDAEVNVSSLMHSDEAAFHIETRLLARSAGKACVSREWRFRIPAIWCSVSSDDRR